MLLYNIKCKLLLAMLSVSLCLCKLYADRGFVAIPNRNHLHRCVQNLVYILSYFNVYNV